MYYIFCDQVSWKLINTKDKRIYKNVIIYKNYLVPLLLRRQEHRDCCQAHTNSQLILLSDYTRPYKTNYHIKRTTGNVLLGSNLPYSLQNFFSIVSLLLTYSLRVSEYLIYGSHFWITEPYKRHIQVIVSNVEQNLR